MALLLTGISGRQISLERCNMQLSWRKEPIVYAFASSDLNNTVPVYYIGETGDASSRMPGHEMWWQATMHGASDVYATVVKPAWLRLDIERDLIHYHKPVLNTEYTSQNSADAYVQALIDEYRSPAELGALTLGGMLDYATAPAAPIGSAGDIAAALLGGMLDYSKTTDDPIASLGGLLGRR